MGRVLKNDLFRRFHEKSKRKELEDVWIKKMTQRKNRPYEKKSIWIKFRHIRKISFNGMNIRPLARLLGLG